VRDEQYPGGATSALARNLELLRLLLPPQVRGLETSAVSTLGTRLLVPPETRSAILDGLARADESVRVAIGRSQPQPVEELLDDPALATARYFRVHRDEPGNGPEFAAELYLAKAADSGWSWVGASPWGAHVPSRSLHEGDLARWEAADRVDFPIDLVYTWVDGDDPEWIARRDRALGGQAQPRKNAVAVDESRFRSRDELRYSLRSVDRFVPFVRRIFLVTDAQVPEWLVDAHDRLQVVDHSEILPAASLPVFNSHAIEAALHRIPGLSEHFLYLNDDFFFGRPVTPELFFQGNGVTNFFLSKARIHPGPARPEDRGVDAAAKNGRDLLIRSLGPPAPERKFMHAPHAQTRSRICELEHRFPEEFERTIGNAFRHHLDISVVASLSHHYGWRTGTAVPGRIRYGYFSLGDPVAQLRERLEHLAAMRDLDVFCLNDDLVGPDTTGEVSDVVTTFLDSYLPEPSSFERVHDRAEVV
jgi:hypothetical protein